MSGLLSGKIYFPIISCLSALARFLRATGFLLSDCHSFKIPLQHLVVYQRSKKMRKKYLWAMSWLNLLTHETKLEAFHVHRIVLVQILQVVHCTLLLCNMIAFGVGLVVPGVAKNGYLVTGHCHRTQVWIKRDLTLLIKGPIFILSGRVSSDLNSVKLMLTLIVWSQLSLSQLTEILELTNCRVK